MALYLQNFYYKSDIDSQQFLFNSEVKDMLPIELLQSPEGEDDNRGKGSFQ